MTDSATSTSSRSNSSSVLVYWRIQRPLEDFKPRPPRSLIFPCALPVSSASNVADRLLGNELMLFETATEPSRKTTCFLDKRCQSIILCAAPKDDFYIPMEKKTQFSGGC